VRTRLITSAVLCAAAAATVVAPPLAAADSCDPAVAACPNYGAQTSTSDPSMAFSPTTIASDDQFPFDSDWYFNNDIGRSGGGGHHGR
jgi:hypothetical protein